MLTRYHADKLIELKDIEEYRRNRDNLLSLTKELLMKLDVRYNHPDYYAETYVKEWLKAGFDAHDLDNSIIKEMLNQLTNYNIKKPIY